MKWIFEFWRSFSKLSVPGGDFWLTIPCQSVVDKYPDGSIHLGVPQTVLADVTSQCLTQSTYIRTGSMNFFGNLLQLSHIASPSPEKPIPLSGLNVLGNIPGDLELTIHPNFVSLRVQFSDPGVSRGYCAFSLRADCLQILLKRKEVRDAEGVCIDLSLSAAVTFGKYWSANDHSFILLSREQVKRLLQLSSAELCRDLFALFGYDQISHTSGKHGTAFGCVTTDLTDQMKKFANSHESE